MMALFLGIVAWVLWPSNRERFRRAARIPLGEDDRTAETAPPPPETGSSEKSGA
ncbi:MAG: cbb3-type cytochrome c oxidase subunit 3 [Rhodospirillaceae bacterium]|nr:cbb3-type cytochrome c oxidase subunit 3 [Rhodospirillaceae bacterium]